MTRAAAGPLLLAALAFCSLLLAFLFVVREAVAQGGARRLAMTAQADASWRCNGLRGRAARDLCLQPQGLAMPTD